MYELLYNLINKYQKNFIKLTKISKRFEKKVAIDSISEVNIHEKCEIGLVLVHWAKK